MNIFYNDKNPADMIPDGEKMPAYMKWLLVLAFVFIVVSCGLDRYINTMDKAVPSVSFTTSEEFLKH